MKELWGAIAQVGVCGLGDQVWIHKQKVVGSSWPNLKKKKKRKMKKKMNKQILQVNFGYIIWDSLVWKCYEEHIFSMAFYKNILVQS